MDAFCNSSNPIRAANSLHKQCRVSPAICTCAMNGKCFWLSMATVQGAG